MALRGLFPRDTIKHTGKLVFAPLTYRESLQDIEACFRAHSDKHCHMGTRSRTSRSTLADASEVRDWRIHADFAQRLIGMARKLYVEEPFGVDRKETVYALDSTTIDLCPSVFPRAPFRRANAAVRQHTLLDLRGDILTFIHISDGKMQKNSPYAATSLTSSRVANRRSSSFTAAESPFGYPFRRRLTHQSIALRTRLIARIQDVK